MRKTQKQQVEELLKQIEEAHDQIKKYIEQGSVQSAMELLADCQNGGITIGTLIEETEGEGHPTVSLLEDYCEALYQIHTDLSENKEINANKAYKLLRQKLIKVENSFRNDIPIRKEVVFLPYKASMWDSLESVWKTADADPDCDAYVIPISYYDKNPDGSFREMHYEGDQYPDYVPVTSYEEYDFEIRKPDVIYIHNPYDEYNLVTSVPSFFFSSNLKKMTEKLVYIPYFVLDEIKPDEDERIEGMKHFVTTPAVFNAHKVIVQSEDMKQVYIKVLLDYTNDYSETARKYWDDKILGTGSPKIDKVLNTKREDLEIPQEWLKIIEKPDGSWKKIVFYNTSIAGLLSHNEQMLRKMKSVFEIFKENQDDVTLLWRPHPLIKATIESMRPQLWIKYDILVRKYREEGWGIYDDSSDVDRAIALSDAYYGDGSSVVQMYRQTRKPIMMQNVMVRQLRNIHSLIVSYCGMLWNQQLIIVSEISNAIMHISIKEQCIKKIYPFKEEKSLDELFYAFTVVENTLYAAPYNACNMYKIDLETGEQEIITSLLTETESNKNAKFLLIIHYSGKLWLIGEQVKKIICIEEADFAKLRVLKQNYGELYWGNNYLIKDNQILVPCRNKNILLRIDIFTQETMFEEINCDSETGFSSIYEYDNNICLIDHLGHEYILTDKYAVTKSRHMPYKEKCIWKTFIYKEKIFYILAYEEKVYVVQGECIEKEINLKSKYIYETKSNGVCFQFVCIEEEYMFIQDRHGIIFKLNMETYEYHILEIKVPVHMFLKEINKKIGDSISENVLLSENESINIQDIIRK